MTDCCAAPGLMVLEEGLTALKEGIEPLKETESVALEECLGRILASDIVSPLSVPPHDNSAMDGYAVRFTDLQQSDTLLVAGQSFAGHPFEAVLPPRKCVRIMTGATIPEGADTVIMQEHTEQLASGVRFVKLPNQSGANIRRAGEDIAEGDVVFEMGRRIRPQDLGTLASLGMSQVVVFRKPVIAVFSTGDELKQPGEALGKGEIYDSNRFVVKAMLSKLNVDVLDLGNIADSKEAIRAAFQQANDTADAVITSGGVSVGEADFTKEVLDELGKTAFWKLAIKPGKPFAFGHLPNSYFFGLPGNPVSATVTFHQLVAPALRHLMNEQERTPVTLTLSCQDALRKQPGRRDFQRGVLVTTKHGDLQVQSTGRQGSGILHSMSRADSYIVLSEGSGGVEAGGKVQVQLFDDLLS